MIKEFARPVLGTGMLFALTCATMAVADEATVQVIRTTTTNSAVPGVQTVTEKRTVVESNPILVEPPTVVVPVTVPAETVVRKTVVTSSPTTYVYESKGEIPEILQTVDKRRIELFARLNDVRPSETVSEMQLRDLRRELDRISGEVSALRANTNVSVARSVVVAHDLDVLADRLKAAEPSVVFVPMIEGSHFTILNGQVLQLDDLAVRRIGLENKILSQQAAGRLTWDQANHLRADLNAIAAREDALRANGQLNFKEERSIYRQMDEVANRMDRMAL